MMLGSTEELAPHGINLHQPGQETGRNQADKSPPPAPPFSFSFLRTAAAAAKSLQSCPTLCDPIDGSLPGSTVPGIGKNIGMGCHFLLQCLKVKSESEVAQSCRTLSDPMDRSPPGSSVHGFSWQEYWSGVLLPSPTTQL